MNHGESWWITCFSFPDWAWNRTSKASQRSQCIHHVALRLELPAPTDDIRYLCAHIADILVRKDMQAQTQSQWTLKVKKQDVKFALQEIEHHLRKSPRVYVFHGFLRCSQCSHLFLKSFFKFLSLLIWRCQVNPRDQRHVGSGAVFFLDLWRKGKLGKARNIWKCRDLEGSGGNWRNI